LLLIGKLSLLVGFVSVGFDFGKIFSYEGVEAVYDCAYGASPAAEHGTQ